MHIFTTHMLYGQADNFNLQLHHEHSSVFLFAYYIKFVSIYIPVTDVCCTHAIDSEGILITV